MLQGVRESWRVAVDDSYNHHGIAAMRYPASLPQGIFEIQCDHRSHLY